VAHRPNKQLYQSKINSFSSIFEFMYLIRPSRFYLTTKTNHNLISESTPKTVPQTREIRNQALLLNRFLEIKYTHRKSKLLIRAFVGVVTNKLKCSK